MKSITMLIVFTTIIFSGCSTIIHGVHQDLQIITSPPGAIARVDGKSCTTPCTLNVWRKSDELLLTYNDTVKKYEVKTSLNNRTNGWTYYLGNITFFGWFPGMIVDNATGGKWTIDNVVYNFNADSAKTE